MPYFVRWINMNWPVNEHHYREICVFNQSINIIDYVCRWTITLSAGHLCRAATSLQKLTRISFQFACNNSANRYPDLLLAYNLSPYRICMKQQCWRNGYSLSLAIQCLTMQNYVQKGNCDLISISKHKSIIFFMNLLSKLKSKRFSANPNLFFSIFSFWHCWQFYSSWKLKIVILGSEIDEIFWFVFIWSVWKICISSMVVKSIEVTFEWKAKFRPST